INMGYGYSYISITPSLTNPSSDVTQFVEENGDTFNSLTLNTSFSHDTRNRTVFATSGIQHILGMNMTIPGSDLEYYKLSYITKNFFQLSSATTLLVRSNIAYGNGYGKNSSLPFFERYFAGGIRTVRGYESNSLGPRDPVTNLPIGGNLRVTAGADYIFPIPFMEKPPSSVRLSAFYDIGNVFLDNAPTFDSTTNGFQFDQLRTSVGISFVWISPIGPLRFSWAKTINEKQGDTLRAFQFSIGSFF
ncbi:MAG TPA: outer membrane protein assembly factor BamA, partial [Thiotrichales bacterium]|nr:outer membrane protein assembly factor BamA [Thiotrichales bacterium]